MLASACSRCVAGVIAIFSAATYDALVVRTPSVGDEVLDQNLSVVLEFSNQLYIDTNHTFTFIRTINVTGVHPPDHLNT